MLEQVGLSEYADRWSTQLSGGQQQRLALARALLCEPEVLLLDEPLSNLDAKLRSQLRAELRSFQQKFGVTTIYVTHDQGEALAMSDTIVVMNRGRIEQIGSPSEIYDSPATRFVADFVGSANLIPGVLDRPAGPVTVWSTPKRPSGWCGASDSPPHPHRPPPARKCPCASGPRTSASSLRHGSPRAPTGSRRAS